MASHRLNHSQRVQGFEPQRESERESERARENENGNGIESNWNWNRIGNDIESDHQTENEAAHLRYDVVDALIVVDHILSDHRRSVGVHDRFEDDHNLQIVFLSDSA